jgi:hypothetical protein
MGPVEWDQEDVRRLYATYEQATRDFDTAIRALSGGALAISITFVHDIANHPTQQWLLAVSWALFVVALGLNLWSFLTSARASGTMLRLMLGGKTAELPDSRTTDWLNWTALVAFVGGVVFLVSFAVVNL